MVSRSNSKKSNSKKSNSKKSNNNISSNNIRSKSNRSSKSNKNSKSNFNNIKSNIKNNSKNIKQKDNFDSATTYPSIIDLLSVSPSAKDTVSVTWQEQLQDYLQLLLKYLFLVTILTLNFLGLSVSLNCNADNEFFHRIISAIFAFFFGFVYLIINYYTYKVLSQGKICKMDRDKLFPFRT
jgi:hypothetical protein